MEHLVANDKVTDYAATGIVNPIGITTGPDGALWFTDAYNPGSFGSITTSGKITIHTSSLIDDPVWITTGPNGALWIADAGTKTYKGSIARITTNGKITVYTNSSIDEPASITMGPDGALWFTNYGSNSIGRITTSGVGTIYAGNGTAVLAPKRSSCAGQIASRVSPPLSRVNLDRRRPAAALDARHVVPPDLERADHRQRRR